MAPKETQSGRVKRAIAGAIHDRRNSWYAGCVTVEDTSEDDIVAALSDADAWPAILEQDVGVECEAKASNGRVYRLSILPIRHFAIRYYAVMCFARHAAGLWHSRLGGDYLSCTGEQSLFLGRARENAHAYKEWQRAQRCRYVLKFDIRAFYPSIRHDMLVRRMTDHCSGGDTETQRMLRFLPLLLRYPYRSSIESEIKRCEIGLPIGNTTERYFSNLYLEPLDVYLLKQTDVVSSRRLDDIRVFGDDPDRLEGIRSELEFQANQLRLAQNPDKTRLVSRA